MRTRSSGKSTKQPQFTRTEGPRVPRSKFDRSHNYKTTMDESVLVPIFCDEALPGDTFNLNAQVFARMATPIHPLMDNLWIDIHFFAVPNRILWDNWHKFMGEQENPGDSTDYTIPQVVAPAGGWAELSPADYLGLPTKVDNISVSALPFRAMAMIWNEWYRDENLQQRAPFTTDDGPDPAISYTDLAPRGKRKDYLTGALPFAQKGPDVEFPIGGIANVDSNNLAPKWTSDGTTMAASTQETSIGGGGAVGWQAQLPGGQAAPVWFGDETGLQVDFANASPPNVSELREAITLQHLFERDARGGTRLQEKIMSHFGVYPPDYRMQRPEYLGGGTSAITVHPVPQTGPPVQNPEGSTPQGNLAAFVTGSDNFRGFSKSFTEHCIVIGYASIRADLNYQQGIHKMWSRKTQYDFYWPSLQGLSEQAILNQEIYADGTGDPDLRTGDFEAWGYAERWSEYKFKHSLITGQMRSNAATSLDTWHVAQDFASCPGLNEAFIKEDAPVERVVAIPSEPRFLLDVWFNFTAVRPMGVWSTPGLRTL